MDFSTSRSDIQVLTCLLCALALLMASIRVVRVHVFISRGEGDIAINVYVTFEKNVFSLIIFSA
jgi:hypothetical protein